MIFIEENLESNQSKYEFLDELSEDVRRLRAKVELQNDRVLKNKVLTSIKVLQNELAEYQKQLCKYPLHTGKPKLGSAYCLEEGFISCTFVALQKNVKYKPDQYVDLMRGYNNYSTYQIDNFLESNGRRWFDKFFAFDSKPDPHNSTGHPTIILSDLDFFYDLYIGSQKQYWVGWDGDQFFVKPIHDNKIPEIEYMKQRFKAYLHGRPRPTQPCEFRLMLEGTMGRWPYKSTAVIDGYSDGFQELFGYANPRSYCHYEILSVNPSHHDVDSDDFAASNPYHNLRVLDDSISNFRLILEKILFKGFFGRKDNVIFGLKNDDDCLFFTFELTISNDIIPFMKEFYSSNIERFEFFIDIIDEKLDDIMDMVDENMNFHDVLKLVCSHSPYVKRQSDNNIRVELYDIIPRDTFY